MHEHTYAAPVDLLAPAMANGLRPLVKRLRAYEGRVCTCGTLEVRTRPSVPPTAAGPDCSTSPTR